MIKRYGWKTHKNLSQFPLKKRGKNDFHEYATANMQMCVELKKQRTLDFSPEKKVWNPGISIKWYP